MAAAKRLRAVTPDEKPKRKPSLVEATASGSYADFLDAMCRETATAAAAETNGTAKAALLRRLAEAKRELEALRATAEEEAAESAGATADEAWEAI